MPPSPLPLPGIKALLSAARQRPTAPSGGRFATSPLRTLVEDVDP